MKKTFSANHRSRGRRTAQSQPLLLLLVVVVCGSVGLLAGRLLARKGSSAPATGTATPTASVLSQPAPNPVLAPTSVEPSATEQVPPQAVATMAPLEKALPSGTTAKARPLARIVKEAPKRERVAASESAVTYGSSVQGRALEAYVLGNGPNVTLFFGAFHGNEPITDDMVLRLRDYLKANPQHLVGKTVILAPVVNPDGLRRGNRANARKVDLNRNFPGTWQKQPTKARYNPGPSPASEPETRAVIQLMDTYRPSKVVSFHQPFHTLNYTGTPGHRLALTMQALNGYPITPDIGYPTPGSFGDYCGKTRRIAIVTYELPSQSASAAWSLNYKAFLAAIKQ